MLRSLVILSLLTASLLPLAAADVDKLHHPSECKETGVSVDCHEACRDDPHGGNPCWVHARTCVVYTHHTGCQSAETA